jgi:hypothetical protein
MELFEMLAPLLIPFAVGAVGTLVASTFITSKRLRTELLQETEMLDRLPLTARKELRRDVQRRTLLLVSINRFPPLTRVDLVALLIAVLSIALGFYWARVILVDWYDSIFFVLIALAPPVYAAIAWVMFFKDWRLRALSRIRWVFKHLGQEESKPIARMVLVGYMTASLVSVTVITSLFATIAGTWLYANEWLSRDAIFLGGAGLVVLATGVGGPIARKNALVIEIGLILSGSRWRTFWVEATPKFKEERQKFMQTL